MATPSSSFASLTSLSAPSSSAERGLDDTVSDKMATPKEHKEEKKEGKDEVKGLDGGGDDDETLNLVSQEGEKVPVAKKIAIMSELVKTMAEGGKKLLPLLRLLITFFFLMTFRVRCARVSLSLCVCVGV
jgi:hypothetical protein